MIQDSSPNQSRGWLLVLAGGLVAGALDITYACVFWAIKAGVAPQRIFQSVAKGLLGPAAFQGGASTAALGLFLHFFIATSMSIAYFVVAHRWTSLRTRPFLFGPIYGLFLYAFMNCVVVPLSLARGGSKDPLWFVLSIIVHMFLIGLPIAMFTSSAFRESRN